MVRIARGRTSYKSNDIFVQDEILKMPTFF
jgi:hypothetical protein